MVERLFFPDKAKRVLGCWIGSAIERYLVWLADRRYSPSAIDGRVPLLVRFGEFARARGARRIEDLPEHLHAFVTYWRERRARRTPSARRHATQRAQAVVQQLLRLIVPEFRGGRWPQLPQPFAAEAPGFFIYLKEERGLCRDTVRLYGYHLRRLQAYMADIGVSVLADLSPAQLTDFLVATARRVVMRGVAGCAGVLRGFLRYARREAIIATDLASAVDCPRLYRLAEIPRSISWEQAGIVLRSIDRSRPVGKRDYAMLVMLVGYGLRAREIAALTLEHLDWRRARLEVPNRKGGHAHVYPLTVPVGEALIAYLRDGRPSSRSRHVFLQAKAPFTPLHAYDVSHRAAHHLRSAGIDVRRPGSHTLRHTCVQRLVDAGFSLKSIGDFVGHRLPQSTQIYGKVAIEPLRAVALARGEDAL